MYKSHLSLKFQVLCEGSSFIASFVEHPECSNFKIYSVFILVFYFDLLLLIEFACVKVKFSWTSRCPAKETVILPLSWSTLYIPFQNVKVPDSGCCIWFVTICPKYMYKKPFILEILGAPQRKQWCWFFRGAHPVYNILKMWNVLILIDLIWFATIQV